MKSNRLKSFRKRAIHMPEYPHIKKAVSYADRTIYINVDARPEANVILYEAPRYPANLHPKDFLPGQR